MERGTKEKVGFGKTCTDNLERNVNQCLQFARDLLMRVGAGYHTSRCCL